MSYTRITGHDVAQELIKSNGYEFGMIDRYNKVKSLIGELNENKE